MANHIRESWSWLFVRLVVIALLRGERGLRVNAQDSSSSSSQSARGATASGSSRSSRSPADNSQFRGNLAFSQPVTAASHAADAAARKFPANVSVVNDGTPDWTAHSLLRQHKPHRARTMLQPFVEQAAVDQGLCAQVMGSSSGGVAWVSVDLQSMQPVGFVRLYDGVDTQVNAAQHVTVVVSKNVPIGDALWTKLEQQTTDAMTGVCGGQHARWNISGWDQPVDVPCFSTGRYVTIFSNPGSNLRLCSFEVYEMNHEPSQAYESGMQSLFEAWKDTGLTLHMFQEKSEGAEITDRSIGLVVEDGNIDFYLRKAIPRRIFENQRSFMWISSVASMMVWRTIQQSDKSQQPVDQRGWSLPSPLCFMFVLSDEPSDSIFLRKYAMPAALRVHYHPDSLPQLQSRGQIALRRANSVPVFANNGIDWWIGQQTSSGRQRAGGAGLVAAQVPYPDYSFFQFGRHGEADAGWFGNLEPAIANASLVPFSARKSQAVWRGQVKIVTPGDYSSLRAAITEAGGGCSPISFEASTTIQEKNNYPSVVLNAFGTHDGGVDRGMSHDDQCKHKAIVFIPSHDRWSTGLKHALLCGSVVLFVENVFNSFGSMGLQPWEHYIPINPDALTICNSLKKAMMWIELHPAQAAAIGLNGQEFARQRLSFDAIHESIFQLLQSYGSLQKFDPNDVRSLWDSDSTDVPQHCTVWTRENTNELVSLASAQGKRWSLQDIKEKIVDRYKQCILAAGASSSSNQLRPGEKQLTDRVARLSTTLHEALENGENRKSKRIAGQLWPLKTRLQAIQAGDFDAARRNITQELVSLADQLQSVQNDLQRKFRAIKLGKRMDNLLFSLLEVGTSDLNKWAGV